MVSPIELILSTLLYSSANQPTCLVKQWAQCKHFAYKYWQHLIWLLHTLAPYIPSLSLTISRTVFYLFVNYIYQVANRAAAARRAPESPSARSVAPYSLLASSLDPCCWRPLSLPTPDPKMVGSIVHLYLPFGCVSLPSFVSFRFYFISLPQQTTRTKAVVAPPFCAGYVCKQGKQLFICFIIRIVLFLTSGKGSRMRKRDNLNEFLLQLLKAGYKW